MKQETTPLPHGSPIYISREDSELLRDTLRNFCGKTFLEIGFGNGSNLLDVRENFSLVVGTDLKIEKRKVPYGYGIEILQADRASCFRENSFDCVAFNPPYLPSESINDLAVDGGENGLSVALGFLEDARRVLREDGTIIVLLSTESSIQAFEDYCLRRNMHMKIIAHRKLFFEELLVFEIGQG